MKCVHMCIFQQTQKDMNTQANRFYTASKCRLLSLIDIHVIFFFGAFYKMKYHLLREKAAILRT